MLLKRITAAGAAVSLAGLASAQITPSIEEPISGLQEPGVYGETASQAIGNYMSRTLGHCPDADALEIEFEGREDLPLQESSLIAAGHLPPDADLYFERYTVSGCGSEPLAFNLTAISMSGMTVPVHGFAGSTRTNALVQMDFMQQVAMMAGVLSPDCGGPTELAVVQTRIGDAVTIEEFADTRAPGTDPDSFTQAWREIWTIRTCEGRFDVPALVALDTQGGFGLTLQYDPEVPPQAY